MKPKFIVYIPDRAAFDAAFVALDDEGKYHITEDALVYNNFFKVTHTVDNQTLAEMKIHLTDAEKYLRPLVTAGLCVPLAALPETLIVGDEALPAMHTHSYKPWLTAEHTDEDWDIVYSVWKPVDEDGNLLPQDKTNYWGNCW